GLRRSRGGAHPRAAHSDVDLDQQAPQDQALGHPRNRPPVIVLLSGGTGGAKLARGLLDELGPDRLAVIANTGDDIAAFGLHVSPDPDLATCLLRTQLLHEGARLTEIMRVVVEAHGVPAAVLPMTDEPVQTYVRTTG